MDKMRSWRRDRWVDLEADTDVEAAAAQRSAVRPGPKPGQYSTDGWQEFNFSFLLQTLLATISTRKT